MTTISAPSSLPVDPPSVPIVEPPVAVDWMATLLEQDAKKHRPLTLLDILSIDEIAYHISQTGI